MNTLFLAFSFYNLFFGLTRSSPAFLIQGIKNSIKTRNNEALKPKLRTPIYTYRNLRTGNGDNPPKPNANKPQAQAINKKPVDK